MEKLQMLLNLLSEYIVGSPFDAVAPQIFKVLSDFCSEVTPHNQVSTGVEKDKTAALKSTPTLTEHYQQLLRHQLAFSGLQRDFQAIKKKLDISKFVNNDITVNQDLFSSRMFAAGHQGDQSKVHVDFDDIKYGPVTRIYHIELSSLHDECSKHFLALEKIKEGQETICEYELPDADLEDLLKFLEQTAELQSNLR